MRVGFCSFWTGYYKGFKFLMEGDVAALLTINHILDRSLPGLLTIFFLSIILIPSAIADYREEKIPNFFSMSGWLIGPIMHFMLSGVDGLLQSGLGFILLFCLTFPLWIIKWFGAADIKLIASVGAIVGGFKALTVLLGIAAAGSVMALVIMIVHGDFLPSLRLIYAKLESLYLRFKLHIEVPLDESVSEAADLAKSRRIPYAIPIAFGTFLTMLYMDW